MAHVDALGQKICRFDTVVTLLSPPPSSSAAAADVDCCAVVLGYDVRSNKLLVRRLDGSTTTVNATDLRIADRSYMQPGMTVVAAASSSADDDDDIEDGHHRQLGLVMCAATELDLARLLPSPPSPLPADGNGEKSAPVVIASAVSPAEVRRAGGEFSVGDYVVSSSSTDAAADTSWLGCVVEVYLDVDVVLDDDGAAKCRVPWWYATGLWTTTTAAAVRVYPNVSNSKEFYLGQRVRGPPGVLKASRWLKGYWKPNHGHGTVVRVDTTCVLVYWLASSSEMAAAVPANLQSPRDLTFFYAGRVSDYPYWIAGNRCFFRRGAPPAASSAAAAGGGGGGGLTTRIRRTTTAAHRDWQKLWRQQRHRRPCRRQRRRRSLDDDDPLAVASTRTTVDVVWQDGTRQHGVPSTSLMAVCEDTVDVSGAVHEMFPGQHVVRRMMPPATTTEEEEERVVGVVRGYSYSEQTVRVSWPDSDEVETLSAYDVSRVYCSPCFGDVVVRRRQPPAPTTDDDEYSPATSTTGYYYDDLSWVGVCCDRDCDDEAEYIYVKWGDGNTSKVLFDEITIIKEPSIDDLLHELGEWCEDDEARDVINTIDDSDEDDDDSDSSDDSGNESDYSAGSESGNQDNGSTLMTRMNNRIGGIVKAMIQLAGKVCAQGKMYLKNGFRGAGASRTDELAATESINDGDVENTSSTAKAGINGGGGDDGCTSTSREDNNMEGHTTAGYEDKPFHFPQFEILQQSPSDHHYLDSMNQEGTDVGRKWTKRVQKEWKILENNNLPDTIYVRVFEDRMDLLRAVMVGASGTPYHDGLFFFDLQLPPSYPTEPPLVNYRSYGLDVNPNLYPSGTVCLSLLNTYGGQHEAELWSPESSTILQVVVSIQGLVLTAQPYYNEPAWAQAGTPMAQRNELPYSESVFLQSLQTMMHVVRRPPVGFEEFVGDHFRRRGQRVIRACEAYRDGCLVGRLDEEGRPTEDSKKRPCSAGFRLALLNVMPRLVEAFASIDGQES